MAKVKLYFNVGDDPEVVDPVQLVDCVLSPMEVNGKALDRGYTARSADGGCFMHFPQAADLEEAKAAVAEYNARFGQNDSEE